MAENKNKPAEKAERERKNGAAEGTEKKPRAIWSWLRDKRWICLLVGSTVLAHALLITIHAMRGVPEDKTGMEVTLGGFAYHGDGSTARVTGAEFDLHISLLKELDAEARKSLERNRYKIEQDIEELLRRAHGADFEDPILTELKREIQETINSSLEVRAVSDVIITDLALTLTEKTPATVAATEIDSDMGMAPGAGSGYPSGSGVEAPSGAGPGAKAGATGAVSNVGGLAGATP